MIRLRRVSLPPNTRLELRTYQAQIDALPNYPSQVSAAKTQFKRYNTKRNATFREVKQCLTRMCSGARRCSYCEDSCADEVEHIKPKDLYPGNTFVWSNYLYACGICNVGKNNQFEVFSAATGLPTRVTRRRGEPILPPERGRPLLINPSLEDPLDFMVLDLLGTFQFVPSSPQGSTSYQRTKHTILCLGLNRDYLPIARRGAYSSYTAELREYIRCRDDQAPLRQLRLLKRAIQTKEHPSVWKEMVRQRNNILLLGALFDLAPEAVSWRVGRSALL